MRRRRGWLTPREVADYWHLHVHTIYRRINSGDLPAVKLPNGQFRIDEAAAVTYGGRIAISAQRRNPSAGVINR